MDEKEFVSAVATALADRVGKHRFDLWFGPPARLLLRDGALYVEQTSMFALEFVRLNFSGHLTEICRAVREQATPIEYRVVARSADPPLAAQSTKKDREGRSPCATIAGAGGGERAISRHAPPTAQRPQRKFARFEDFVEGPSNCVAMAAARMVIERTECFSSLFLHGLTGVGKTHLLEAIWSASRAHSAGPRAVYLSAEQFTTFYVEAVQGKGLPNFRRKYRGVGLLLIDDIQFFDGKKATLMELLHTVDTLLRDGQRVVFTADRAPADLRFLGPELATRIVGGAVARIESPEFELRCEILRRKARALSIEVPQAVLVRIAQRLPATARELTGALHRLLAASMAYGRPISLELADETLGDLFRDAAVPWRLTEIQQAVCQVFGLEPDTLQSKKKRAAVSRPRMLAMWLARKYTRAALSEIGSYFGGRTHATVISAQKKVDEWVAKGETLQVADHACSAEEAIRRVEDTLRVRAG
jgi:chromosomal replication initiator protein